MFVFPLISLKRVALTCGFLLAVTGASVAQTGQTGEFTIYNNTSNNFVIGFYTNDGSGWSSNWLSEEMEPGSSATAAFSAEEGACEQTFQVGWLGENGNEVLDDPIDIDICEASNVYLDDNEIYFD